MSQQDMLQHTDVPTVVSHENNFDLGSESTWGSHTAECIRLVRDVFQ
jgi:hypothetical protein